MLVYACTTVVQLSRNVVQKKLCTAVVQIRLNLKDTELLTLSESLVMSNPIKYMMDHKQVILDAYNRNSSPAKSWSFLCEQLPDFESAMKFNTFKQYYRAFVLIVKEYEERKNNISGWTVSQGKDGYYRGNRRVKGKLISVYLGKEYNREVFNEKILKKQRKIGIV